LAWSRSKHLETTIASGVDAYKVDRGELELQPLLVDFCLRWLTRLWTIANRVPE
jgi:hypothetical protein